MQGDTLNNHRDHGPSYVPDLDPGRFGGGTYTAQNVEPTIEAYENIFGPSARDIKLDLQRFKRHGRWHLPDILRGPNTYLTDRVDGLITDATKSPFTSTILPYKYIEQPDGKIKWNVWSFDEGLASRVPYESAARTLTQSKKAYSGYMVRQGMAIVLEHNFMMSDAGRTNFKRQLTQLVGSVQLTNDLDVHVALVLAPSYQKDIREKYISEDKTSSQICREFIDLFGFVQKNQNALDILIEEAKAQLKVWGGPTPSFLMCNSKLTFQLTMTPDVTNYVVHGNEGQKRLKAGPDIPSYRGINIIHTRAFSMEPGAPPRDILRRRVRVAEYYRIKPHPENYRRVFQFYNEERDTWFTLTFKELLQYARTGNAPTHNRHIKPELPGAHNHSQIEHFAQTLSGKMKIAQPLQAQISLQERDFSYNQVKAFYVALFQKTTPMNFCWNPMYIAPGTVYVPGNMTRDKTYIDRMWEKNHWDQLPQPIKDAVHDVNPEFGDERSQREFVFQTYGVQKYPREWTDSAEKYFFHGVTNPGATAVGYNFFDNTSVLPEAVNQNLYEGRTSVVVSAAAGYDFADSFPTTFQNRPAGQYNFAHFTRVYHFRNFNRYGVGRSILQDKYQKATSISEGLRTQYPGLVSQRMIGTTSFCDANDRLRNLGAFFCPNHYKNRVSPPAATWGGIVGWNTIVNFDLVQNLTMTKSPLVSVTRAVDFNNVHFRDKQYEQTFLYDYICNYTNFPEFTANLKRVLEAVYVQWSSPTNTNPYTRSRLTKDFVYGSSTEWNNAADSTFAYIMRQQFALTENRYNHPGPAAKYRHYWYWPKADVVEDEVFTMTSDEIAFDRDTVAATNPNYTMSTKQALIAAQWYNCFELDSSIISDFSSTDFYDHMDPIQRNMFFLTAPVTFPKNWKISDHDCLDWAQTMLFRLFADQEVDPPAIWHKNPLDNLNMLPALPYMPIPPPVPPGMPPGGGGMPYGGGMNPYPGLEHIEIVIIRPNIEHYMLGIILGQGGESLGNTFWGQTELSCYDDSMHGIWGMSYKYHSRAVVINTKNLVRLWDIAYDGYVGGKDDSHVDWTNARDVEEFVTNTMDVSKHYHGKSMMVMAFDHSQRTQGMYLDRYNQEFMGNWPSPIVFYDTGNREQQSHYMDFDNIHVADTSKYRIFNKSIYENGYSNYFQKMPNFYNLHKIRKNAALAAVENEVSSDALAFQGTMKILDTNGHEIECIHGSGHHGPDYIGVASIRSGKGYKFQTQPSLQRLV